MKLNVHNLGWGTVLSTATVGLDFKLLEATCPSKAIVVAPGLLGGQEVYGGRLKAVPREGLVPEPNFSPPDEPLTRTLVPLGGLIVIGRVAHDMLGGLPPLPIADDWRSLVVALALKAYWVGVHCCVSRQLPTIELPEPRVGSSSLLNLHFVHAAYFSPQIFAYIWEPMLLEQGYVAELDAVFKSPDFQCERKWFTENRVRHEEIFFRRILGSQIDDLMEVDAEAGRAKPLTRAAYIAYEARRSPGREWGADKGRLNRHTDELIAHLSSKGLNLSRLQLLDLGSRDGAYLEQLAEKGMDLERMEGIEISPWSARHARSVGRPVHVGDMHDLGCWEDDSKDVISTWHSIEHCHSPNQALSEMRRVLKPDGLLMVVAPLEPKGISLKGDHCHVFRSADDVIKLVVDAGFRCTTFNTIRHEFTGFFELVGSNIST